MARGYRCHIQPNRLDAPYTLNQLDFFAAYIIPQDAWYLIPARVLLNRGHLKKGPMLFPMRPLKKNRYLYESYREAWDVLRPDASTNAAASRFGTNGGFSPQNYATDRI